MFYSHLGYLAGMMDCPANISIYDLSTFLIVLAYIYTGCSEYEILTHLL